MFRPIAPLAAALMLLTPLAVSAETGFNPAAMSDAERDAFRSEIREYLIENPEVILEAIRVLEDREAEQKEAMDDNLVQSHAEALFNDGYSWVGGNPDGDITIVEFMDYRCGYCRKAFDEVAELVESDGNIRFIVKELPILGEASMISSRFAVATKMIEGDAAYGMVHDALMKLTGNPDEVALARMADSLGLDSKAILTAMDSPDVARAIAGTRTLAQQLQINGTPTFVMGDQLVRGYVPLEAMREIIRENRS